MASEPVSIQQKFKFEDFELDLRLRELRRADRVLKLERIPMELLLLLIEHSDEVVTRDQIVETIWGKDVFLDTDNSINGAVRKIRQVLRDNPEQPRFVQTITGKGYRFIAPLSDFAPGMTLQFPTAHTLPPKLLPIEPQTRKSALPRWAVLLVAGVVLTVAVGAYWKWFQPRPQRATSAPRLMLAVLPFENLTGDAGQDYFSDGFTEEMITQLGRLDPAHLAVIARTSVMPYKNRREPLDQIGRKLGVQYVLEGSVRRDSGKVRITAQLIQVRDQTHLWAREYDRQIKDFLALQSEIAIEVADEIQLALGDSKKSEPARQASLTPQAYEAYDLYLKGQYFWNQRTPEAFRQAAGYFQQAIAKDPNYARAHAGLADCYALMSSYYLGPPGELMPKARESALKALQLDDGLAAAHTALALIAEEYDWDWGTAEKEYRRAIQLDPNYATAHQWYAEFLAFEGRFDEALVESERARQLDPLSLIIAVDRGAIFYFSRNYDRAIAQLQTVLDMNANIPRTEGVLACAYAQEGRFDDAFKVVDHLQRTGDSAWALAHRSHILFRAGQHERALRTLAEAEQVMRRRHLDPAPMLATAYAGMGKKDESLFWLEKTYQGHSSLMTTLKVEPIFDSLRTDPRFQDLLRRVGF